MIAKASWRCRREPEMRRRDARCLGAAQRAGGGGDLTCHAICETYARQITSGGCTYARCSAPQSLDAGGVNTSAPRVLAWGAARKFFHGGASR